MSAVLKIWRRISLVVNGVLKVDYGSVDEPAYEVTVDGSPQQSPRTFSVAAGASQTVWAYATDGAFLEAMLESSGFAWVSVKVDKPTSTTNHAATGTAINYPKFSISNTAPCFFPSPEWPVNTSSANYAGSHFHASTETGYIYEIVVKNPNAAAIDVTLQWTK